MENRFEEILKEAVELKSTDIHFLINDDGISISIRTINGLTKLESFPDDIKLFNYLQYQSHLDITSIKPQSGSFSYFFEGVYYDFRFAVLITSKNKSGVLRILNCHNGLPLEQLTFEKEMHEVFIRCINQRSGLILFSGLTGSGKTTTMYSLLKLLENKTIYSLEDPIEVIQPNITQLEINERIGFDFSEGIRQILRHNPDVLMIGEIRDEKTAKSTVRAALTGCLVISSIHSQSTISALHRIIELGVKKEDLINSMSYVFNQCLFKRYKQNNYICIYDCLNNEKITSYLKGEEIKIKMPEKIKQAIQNKIIEGDIQYE
ncbi:MAG: ATPase, T2SS/T4P/T4SS family [Bacillota bacterium]|jgi:competence protein ComGA|nr:ATPase, T2SS/T4P/T4SS family [Bacillota bacterium]NLL27044.1 Flp pilus assembly complex ATPase component TadA [Erysipelotrichia bacterium]